MSCGGQDEWAETVQQTLTTPADRRTMPTAMMSGWLRCVSRTVSNTSGRIITSSSPLLSSRLRNVIPLAVPGRWRTTTILATCTRCPAWQKCFTSQVVKTAAVQGIAVESHDVR